MRGRDLPELNLPFEAPAGFGAAQIAVAVSDPVYESFGPSVYQPLAEHSLQVSEGETIFYAIQAGETGGYASFVIGTQESFSPLEIVLNPVVMLGVYLWQGQSWLGIPLPAILAVAASLVLYTRLSHTQRRKRSFLAYMSASVFLAAPAVFLYQMWFIASRSELGAEILVSVFILTLQLNVTRAAYRLTRAGSSATKRIIVASLGLLLWTGYIFAPIILAISGFRQNATSTSKIVPDVVL